MPRWVLLAASLVVTLAVAELVARLAVPANSLPPPPARRTIDPYAANPYIVSYRPYLHMFLPGSRYRAERPSYLVDYEINAHGFRGPEIPPKSGHRLLVLGDSVPEGHGVEFDESLVPRLDDALADTDWSVVNAAVQGGSPIHYAANLPRYLALAPDAVLIVLYENDLWDDRRKEAEYFDLPVLDDPQRVAHPEAPAACELRLWTLARRAVALFHDTDLERHIRANRDTERPETAPDAITPIILAPTELDRQWEMSEAYLDYLAAELARRDVALLVSVFAAGTLVPRAPAAHGEHARALEQRARAWSERRGVPFLSLLGVTERALHELPWEGVLIPDDGHPTAEMHRRLAAALAPWLRANLPEPRSCRRGSRAG